MEKKTGLTNRESKKRLKKYGSNEIKRTRKVNPYKIFISQFTSPLILILIVAALISLFLGFFPNNGSNFIDATLILIIVFVSGIAGFLQEYKSEKTIEALRSMSVPQARVMRDGKIMLIEITKIVPGDLILLEAGDMIPADSKLVESYQLTVDESILTGESRSVKKKIADMIFMNTFVTDGSARAVVKQTGMHTKVGAIASKLQNIVEAASPFQREVAKLSTRIFVVILGIIVLIMAISLLKYSLYTSLFTAISLAVAAIPEGLPAIVVLTLATAAGIMSQKKALIRRLAVTESLGAVNIICTDKTGTLTRNQMTVTRLFFDNKTYVASELNEVIVPELKLLFLCGALCNDSIENLGDQTEVAIRMLSEKHGFDLQNLHKKFPRVNEITFSSKRKMMSVVCREARSKNFTVYTKGAAEVLLEHCDRIYDRGKIRSMLAKDRQKILEQNKSFSSEALRVLGFAYKKTKDAQKGVENHLIWLGLEAMIDPPRDEAQEALNICRTAGIRVIMLTGDNPETAQAIARSVGLKTEGVLEGKDVDRLSDLTLQKKLDAGINVLARISPFHKLRIFEVLGKQNMVAMTGDGVNDALALKKADVGISMGLKGTEVAKEASDMILLDDNFATIGTAIREGRRIFDNIRKFINYLFVCNMAEVGVLFLATLFITLKDPILLPVQLLWINLLTDGLPALALGVDPARPNVMLEPPRKKGEPIINKTLWWLIGTVGIKKMIVLFAVFYLTLSRGVDVARTVLFTGFILYEFVRIATIRYQEKLTWLSNRWLLGSLFGSLFLQILIIYTPINRFFHIVPLGVYEWIVLIIGTIVGYITAILITKLVLLYVHD